MNRVKAFYSAGIFALLVCACGPMPIIQDDRDVTFSCTNGESISVRFAQATRSAILMRNGESIELQQQPSGSGFIYSNGPNTIRGKGDNLSVELGRRMPIQCVAI